MPTLVAPTRNGYIFCGYYDKATDGVQYYDATMTSKLNWNKLENATLYAQWTDNICTVTFNEKGGLGGSESVKVLYGRPMPTATAPTRENFFFRGYFAEATGGTQYYNYDMTSTRNWDLNVSTKTLYAVWDATTKGLEFDINADKLGYTISGYTGTSAAVSIPAMYKGLPVTKIGDSAFKNNNIIASVTIPDGVTTIGQEAFNDCYNLKTVTFGAASQLGTIGASAFYNCSVLTSITIPSGVESIRENTFAFCSELTTVSFGAGSKLQTIGVEAFTYNKIESIKIPDSVTDIGKKAFDSCENLKTVTFGTDSKLRTIGMDTFNLCDIASIAIPNSVTSIGDGAFKFCTNLTTITFGADSKLDAIGVETFKASGLTSITIPKSIEFIEANAFESCGALATVNFGAGSKLVAIRADAFNNCAILTSITISSSVYELGANVFSSCNSLTIYAEDERKTNGWAETWNSSSRPVVWGVTLSADKAYVVSYTKAAIDNPTAEGGIKAPYRAGFIFANWTAGGSVIAAKDLNTVADGTKLTAFWTPVSFTVNFEGNGATSGIMPDQAFSSDIEQSLTKNVFRKTGYTFTGWATTPDGKVAYTDAQFVINLAEDGVVNLYAVWKPISFIVKFHGNSTGLLGTMDEQKFYDSEAHTLTKNCFTKWEHTFAGWATSPTGAVVYKDEESVKNLGTGGKEINLYAVWTKNP